MNNFTPRANQVLTMARKEAFRLHHLYLGTEHLLLGLLHLEFGCAVTVLLKNGMDLETLRTEVEKRVEKGPEIQPIGNALYTPRTKKALTLAGKEAASIGHAHVGPEHILLGLLREGEGIAACVLKVLNFDLEHTRNEILRELGSDSPMTQEDQSPKRNDPKPIEFDVKGRILLRSDLRDLVMPKIIGCTISHVIHVSQTSS
jgi:ATP-dependent Clp protease ATP-binding subunit ClpC